MDRSSVRDIGRWGLVCSICKRNTARLREHLKTRCMKGFSDSEIQTVLDASTVQMQRISRNFVMNMEDFGQMGGTECLAKRLQERGFVFSWDSKLDRNVGEEIIGKRDEKVLTSQLDRRFICDRNVLEKVLGGTAVSEKRTELCVPVGAKNSLTCQETEHFGHSSEATRSVGMLKMTATKQHLKNLSKQDNVQVGDGKGETSSSSEAFCGGEHSSKVVGHGHFSTLCKDYCTSRENLSKDDDVIFLRMESSDPDTFVASTENVMLKQSNITGEIMNESNSEPLQRSIYVDNKGDSRGTKSHQNLATKCKYGHYAVLTKCKKERKKPSPMETNVMEKLMNNMTREHGTQLKKYIRHSGDNITGEDENPQSGQSDDIIAGKYVDCTCSNHNMYSRHGEVGYKILKENIHTNKEELVPMDKIITSERDVYGTKPFQNQTRANDSMVNTESKAERRTRNLRRNIYICRDQSQDDDLVFHKMELKDPVVVVEKLSEHVLCNNEVMFQRKRIKSEQMEGSDDKIHSKQLQTDLIRVGGELNKATSYKKVGRRKNVDKWLEENTGQEEMPCEKQLESRQVHSIGDGTQQMMNSRPQSSVLKMRSRHQKQCDLHRQANLLTLNMPCHKDEEEVVFLNMTLNDPVVDLGNIDKITNHSQHHQYKKKKIKLETTLENTASEIIEFDPPSQTAEQLEISSTKNGKCRKERAKEGKKQNHCLEKALHLGQNVTITGMSGERPVCMETRENHGEKIHEAKPQGIEYKANFSCQTRKNMSKHGLYKLHDVNEGVLKDFYFYLLNERGNRTSHCVQMTRSVGKILFYMNPYKIDLRTLKNNRKLIKFYQELRLILKASSITIFIRALYLFIVFLETMNNTRIDFNLAKKTLKNLKNLNTRSVQKELAQRHFNMLTQHLPTMTDLLNQLHLAKQVFNEEIMKAKAKRAFSICKMNAYFYMVFAFRHFQRKCVFENLTIEEWNKRMRHNTEKGETHVILAIKNHKTLSSQLAMIALSLDDEQQMEEYLEFRPKSLRKEFFLSATKKKIRDASHLLASFQRSNKLKRITGTQARRTLETNVYCMQDIERRSVCDYLCHSTRVAEKYYRLKTPQSCVYARKVITKLINTE